MSEVEFGIPGKHSRVSNLGFDLAGVGRTGCAIVVAGLAGAVNALVQEIRMRRSMAELSGLSESMLRDVGLLRLDVVRVVRPDRF
jgi:uncharacterized protein YjiS (DUF1127 family)